MTHFNPDAMFPFESFGVRLEVKTENKIAWFKDDIDLQKHLNRYKLDKRTIKIDYRDGEHVKSNQKHKNNVQSGTGKTSNRSTSCNQRSTKSVDSNRNIGSTRKPKSK